MTETVAEQAQTKAERAIENKAREAKELSKRFSYHPPKDNQPAKYVLIRDSAFVLATLICDECPDSRERMLALNALDEVVFFANASIARRSE